MRASMSAPNPRAPPIEEQGFGWKNTFGTGRGADTITSGLEGAWTTNPDEVGQQLLLENLFGYEWELGEEPGRRATSGLPRMALQRGTVPDAHDPSKRHAPMMFTTDLALRMDPIYAPIAKRFRENPQEFADAFAKAWYQADAPRHGASRAVPRPARSQRKRSAVAGPRSRSGS